MHDTQSTIVPPIDRTLTDQVVRELRARIILGQLLPGERLVEHQLRERLQVSRGTVREALRRLEAESLIETTPHRGSKVANLALTDVVEICELHSILETYATHQLPLPVDDRFRTELVQITEQMRGLRFPGDVDRFIEADNLFHRVIVGATGQRRVLHVWNGLGSLLGILVVFAMRYLEVDGPSVAARHQTIIDALSQADHDTAAAAVSAHYLSLADQIQDIALERTWGVGTTAES